MFSPSGVIPGKCLALAPVARMTLPALICSLLSRVICQSSPFFWFNFAVAAHTVILFFFLSWLLPVYSVAATSLYRLISFS